uniref:unspecific monooxygenase n=1 Tax=Dicentrarchus labrax TaxID=13489 RepID=A0A8P4JYK4_DICLA
MGYLPFFSLETWILLITFICIFVMYGNWTYRTFEKLGIPGPKPVMYWGTLGSLQNFLQNVFVSIFSMYELKLPMLAVMDPEMLKTILVKECFTYFTNRRNLRLNGDLYDAVSIAEDDQWRRIRNILSPSFTSGRIKEMFTIMKHHSHKLTTCLQSKVRNGEVVNIKDFFGPYSMDVMVSCAFSVDMDTISNPSCPLITHASKLFRFSLPLFIFQGTSPLFHNIFFIYLYQTQKSCESQCFKNPMLILFFQNSGDILQHMINSQTTNEPKNKKQNKGLTDHEIVSQITMLAFAGYETSALTLVFLAYNLARNPEVMKRLQEEIDSTFPNKGPIEYEALVQMEYLDCVLCECLRLYPPAARLERTAKETVRINRITIPKDMVVMVPVYALHRDPELWPEPEEFKPERFSKENKQNINPYTYLPFGFGPRNCIGMRFALVMVKLALVEVLQNYSFSVCAETEIPLKMDAEGLVGPLNPIKLKLVTRSIKGN